MHIRKSLGLFSLAATLAFAQQSGTGNATNNDTSHGTGAAQTQGSHQDHGAAASGHAAGHGQQTSHNEQTPATLGPNDHKFMMEAARGSLMEIKVAELAQQKAESSDVKEFAEKLKQDHTNASKKLQAIAQERGVQLPTDLGPHDKMFDTLNSASGAEFDRIFKKMQVEHHKKDVNKFRKASKNSMDSDLRDFASTSLPVLEGHLSQAQSLQSGTGSRARTK
jgi:putative membrane protein